VYIHAKYDSDFLNNDIAILVLDAPVLSATPASLMTEGFTAGAPALVLGWGLVNDAGDGVMAQKLQLGRVNLVKLKTCWKQYNYNANEFARGMMCAYRDNIDSCQGDSGGPLLDITSQKVVGVVSWGKGCAKDQYPGVYTEIAVYKGWIKRILDKPVPDSVGGDEEVARLPLPPCECRAAWTYRDETFEGCADPTNNGDTWCYVKDNECTGARESSTWDSMHWSECSIKGPGCDTIDRRWPCKKAGAACKWNSMENSCPTSVSNCCVETGALAEGVCGAYFELILL
jgi:hypothetical protein